MSIDSDIKKIIGKYKLVCLEGTNCVGKDFFYENVMKKIAGDKLSFYKPFRASWENHASPHGRGARHFLDFDLSQAKNISLDFFYQLIIEKNIPPKTIVMDRGFLSTWAYLRYKRKYLFPSSSETKYFDKRLQNFFELLSKSQGAVLMLLADKKTLLQHRELRLNKNELVPPVLQILSFQKYLLDLVAEFRIKKIYFYQVTKNNRYGKINFSKAKKITNYFLPMNNRMSKLKIYLAGPVFNPEQKQLIHELELFLENENYIVFSPFRDGIVIKPKDNEKIKREAFLWNCEKIKEADVVLAILDYVGAELYTASLDQKKVKVNIPDTGTVWELGFAYSNNKLIVGYTKETKKINLMLAVGIDFIVTDFSALTDVLENLTTYIIDKKYGYSRYNKKILENTRNKYRSQKLLAE